MKGHRVLVLRRVELGDSEIWHPEAMGMGYFFGLSGKGVYSCGCNQQELTQGDVLAVEDAGKGTISPANGSGFTFKFFSLQTENLYPLFVYQEIPMLQTVMKGFSGSKLFGAASPLAQKCNHLMSEVPAEPGLEQRSQLLRIASVILTEEFAKWHRGLTSPICLEDHMNEVFEQASADELSTLPVGMMAKKFGCSRRHLNRLFQMRFGLSAGKLRLEIRLLKAVSLLQTTNLKVINVAEQCQFNHLGHFNTYFKRRFGCSPSEWRHNADRGNYHPQNSERGAGACQLRNSGLCPLDGAFKHVCPVPKALQSTKRNQKSRVHLSSSQVPLAFY